MKLAARIGITEPPGPLRVFAAPERVAHWRSRIPPGARWVAVHISAREPGRVWPTEHFVSLIRGLKVGVVLLWAPGAADDPRHPGDDARSAAIVAGAGSDAILVPARTESLEDLTAVLSLCHAFIGPDGGALHVAAGLGLPVVALFENLPHKKLRWYPWRVPYELVAPDTRNIADIPVERVIQAWTQLSARLEAKG
jgi:ADP-heptose:LPS heptosyltransferase